MRAAPFVFFNFVYRFAILLVFLPGQFVLLFCHFLAWSIGSVILLIFLLG